MDDHPSGIDDWNQTWFHPCLQDFIHPKENIIQIWYLLISLDEFFPDPIQAAPDSLDHYSASIA
jgi:hypothetical protein